MFHQKSSAQVMAKAKSSRSRVAVAVFVVGLALLSLSSPSSSAFLSGFVSRTLSSPAHPNGGTIRAAGLGWAGFNNQRQVLMVHAWAARELGWDLLLPRTFDSHVGHGSPALPIDEVYDVEGIREYVGGEVRFHDDLNKVDESAVIIEINKNCRPGALTGDRLRSVVGEAVARRQKALGGSPGGEDPHEPIRVEFPVLRWENIDAVLPDGEEGRSAAHDLYSAFQFTDGISRCADTAAKDVLAKRCPKGVHAIHLRVGDKTPLPLFDCGRGENVLGKSLRLAHEANHHCVSSASSGKYVTMGEVLAFDLPPAENGTKSMLGAGQCVYVATNGPKSDAMQEFRDWAKMEGQGGGNGLEVFTYEDVVLHSGDAMLECREGGNRAIPDPSLFEQALLSRTEGRYVPDYPSSWDEYVLHARLQREEMTGEKMFMAKEDLDLYRKQMKRDQGGYTGRESWCIRVPEDKAGTTSAFR